MTEPLDVAAQLRGLKDFQLDTAVHVFGRLYDDHDPAHRFLVADEVGLGKTLVARGVIAQATEHLRRLGTPRIDVVYICSNAAIARQNIRRLNPTGAEVGDVVDRLTMLPVGGAGLSDTFNLLPITPGTSLDFGRRTGAWRERALLHWFVRELYPAVGRGTGVLRAFAWGIDQGGAEVRFANFRRDHRSKLDWSAYDRLSDLIVKRDVEAAATGGASVGEELARLADGFRYANRRYGRPLHDLRKRLIGELRTLLAEAAIELLEPDLVILDEFQRFKTLLDPARTDPAAKLARQLFHYTETATNQKARVLMLSATPYKMYTLGSEVGTDDHYRDLLATADFLFDDRAQTDALRGELRQLRQALVSLPVDDGRSADAACRAVEQRLGQVMVRTERLASTPDRSGMLVDRARTDLEVRPSDVAGYAATARIADELGQRNIVEYWKSAPYLLNFMEGYELKRAFDERVHGGGDAAFAQQLTDAAGMLRWDEVDAYRELDPANGRLRALMDETVATGAWRLLWLPPSAPYYRTDSEFDEPASKTFTKRLLFSSWAIVPKTVASLVSYEVERRLLTSTETGRTRTHADPGTGRRLDFALADDGSPSAMANFVLLYPSFVLAELVDPLATRVEDGSLLPLADVRRAVRTALEQRLGDLLDGRPTTGRVDRRWYWAASVYLDWRDGDDDTHDFAVGSGAARHWTGDDQNPGRFGDHVAQLQHFLAQEQDDLGRMPDDLFDVLIDQTLASPAVAALRAFGRQGFDVRATPARRAAAHVAWGFRSLLSPPDITEYLASRQPASVPYWRACLRYAVDGNLQAVLDEYVHVLRDWRGHRLATLGAAERQQALADLTETMVATLSMRTAGYAVDVPEVTEGCIEIERERFRGRFAVPFGDLRGADDQQLMRAGQVTESFNSPFWPFVVASTSVGQEGLDFHLYSHAVVHWNLPSNPVDLEQREGRVHRYKGHAVRKNVAARHGAALSPNGGDPWEELFQVAADQRTADDSEIVPFWVYPLEGGARVERHVPMLPFSREVGRYERLKRSLAAYRLAFGAPRQEELVSYLAQRFDADQLARLSESLRVDLSPRSLTVSERRTERGEHAPSTPGGGTLR
jgi:hypothetical protein